MSPNEISRDAMAMLVELVWCPGVRVGVARRAALVSRQNACIAVQELRNRGLVLPFNKERPREVTPTDAGRQLVVQSGLECVS